MQSGHSSTGEPCQPPVVDQFAKSSASVERRRHAPITRWLLSTPFGCRVYSRPSGPYAGLAASECGVGRIATDERANSREVSDAGETLSYATERLLNGLRHPHHPSRQLARFAVVGLVNTAINVIVYRLLLGVATPYVIAAPLGFAAGSVNSYVFNLRWTFATSDSTRTRASFVAIQALGAATATLLVLLFIEAAGAGKVVADLAAIPPVTVGTFLANRRWTFPAESARAPK
jgi:putative flippase GtrA